VLGLIAGGLEDFSVSRPAARARGWGIGVPGDPAQVIYVWWDALGNYITSLRYGTGGQDYQRWWAEADQRIHLVGKGVLRFHAVYWPAILLSAGEELPTDILVHDYLTVDGRKISKSAGTAAGNDPAVLTDTYGADAVRWWLLRDVPRAGDADFTVDRLIGRANDDLANGLGNLVSRVVSLAHSSRNGVVRPCARPAGTSRWLAAGGGCGAADAPEWPADAADLLAAIERAPGAVRDALARFDFRAATAAVWAIVEQANRYVDATEPWHLARAEKAGDAGAGARLDAVLGALLAACQVLAAEIWPFLPDLAARLAVASNESGGVLPPPRPLFPRIETGQYPATARGKARFAAC
jgi:methionyl-tRNA synthetase